MRKLSMTVGRYSVCVDISAKLESWDKPSVIAVANGYTRALLVRPEVKRQAAKLLKSSLSSPAEPVQFTLMALLTYIAVLPDIDRLSKITLDRDYSGEVAERRILRRLLSLIRRERPNFRATALRMDTVADSRADRLAREVYRGLRRPDGEILMSDIESAL
jgi:hypothetical protein